VLHTETEPNQTYGADTSRIRWRRMVNVYVTIKIRSLVSEAPKTFLVSNMAWRRTAFTGKHR